MTEGDRVEGGGIIIEILQLVDQLEDLLNESWRIPLTSTLLVNEEECLRIIDQFRAWLPEELKQAQRIKQEKDRIIDEADREAQRIVAQVRAFPWDASQRQTSVQITGERSKAIIAEAAREAQALRDGASKYAQVSLEGLQQQLETLLDEVRRGIAHLESTA